MNFRTMLTSRDQGFMRGLSRRAIIKSAKTGKGSQPNSTPKDNDTNQSEADRNKHRDTSQPEELVTSRQVNDSNPADKDQVDRRKESATGGGAPGDSIKNRELYRVRASRLVDLFPNELIIREKSISVALHDLLFSRVETWNIEDIGEVTLSDAPLFASLHLVGKFPEHRLDLKGIPKAKAKRAKELLDGLTLEDQGAINITDKVDPATHREMLNEAGKLPKGTLSSW